VAVQEAAPPSGAAGAFVATGAGTWRLNGSLSFDSVPALRPSGLALLVRGAAVTIDLQGVPAADSAGLALLIDWLAVARAQGCTLRYVGLPAALRALAALSEVEALISP
jgi:phospholipid transport system transporter-binding protein